MPTPIERQDSRLMREMFHTIAPRYDFFTRAVSYGMDRRWKRAGVNEAALSANRSCSIWHRAPAISPYWFSQHYPVRAVAVDLTEVCCEWPANAGQRMRLCRRRAASLPRPFLRLRLHRLWPANFPSLTAALREIERVTRPGESAARRPAAHRNRRERCNVPLACRPCARC